VFAALRSETPLFECVSVRQLRTRCLLEHPQPAPVIGVRFRVQEHVIGAVLG